MEDLAMMVSLEEKDILEILVYPMPSEREVNLVQMEDLDRWETLDSMAFRELLDLRVKMDFLGLMDGAVLMAPEDQMA